MPQIGSGPVGFGAPQGQAGKAILYNAALTIGEQSGTGGRRAVTVEYLQYNPDGTLKPVVQTGAGVSVPPPPAD